MKLSVKNVALAVVGAALLVGVWLLVDYLVVTEEERLEAFSEAVTGEMTSERLDAALEYVDLSAEPLQVIVLGEQMTFEPGEQEELRTLVHRRAGSFLGDDLRLISRTIEIEETSARVLLRGGSDDGGVLEMSYELERQEEGWRIRRARFRFDRTGGLHLF